MTVYYADPPYNQGLPIQKDSDGNHFIQLSPIVRLEPDGYQFTPNSTRKALLQVPVPYINQIASLEKNDNFNIPIKIICRSYGCEKWEQQDVEYECSRDKNGYYCLTFAVSHFSDYVVYSYVKSTIYSILKYIFPSWQQRIKTLAFLSEIDTSNDTVHMKLILSKKDEDETAIVPVFDQTFIRIRLATTGLENTILDNGDYEAKFKKRGLDYPEGYLKPKKVTINWNESSYHAIHYFCKVIDKAAIDIAQIFLQPQDQKQDTNEKACYLRRVNSNEPNPSKRSDSEKLPVLPTKDDSVLSDEMDTEFFDIIAEKLHINDLLRLGNLLHLSEKEVDEIKLREHGGYDKVYKVLKLWKNNAGQKADISVVVAALRKMKKNSIADQLEEKIAEWKRSI
ncbi:uncharacterized protein TRIADDRAFT_52843 [Trichoplax adhaerens]|uniref:Death domain-containing protein n=1 Tax=Trichoplax adhaerens TaxID=10228 RepID=B3RKP4_TRIAD|nr:predicted protein [Trichoplax adhaerens]EDV29201.1 predicted protein [Trichoplax adhaerens]|eukprot:XP_002108403.1 predicted protein [Trichoplax adhaerens]